MLGLMSSKKAIVRSQYSASRFGGDLWACLRIIVVTFGMLVVLLPTRPGFCEMAAVEELKKTNTNRLINSGSPYLLQHAHNPVDWYPWGDEAFKKAKAENKLIFLSVGYSTCYWCHVAERTIYANQKIAELMNKWFVNIKVDREERPDIDAIYMLARQILAGGGGWPNNVFLTPDLKPFFAGSYFPPKDSQGQMGFPSLLKAVHGEWQTHPGKILAIGEDVFAALKRVGEFGEGASRGDKFDPQILQAKARRQIMARFDSIEGGFNGGDASKFPQSPLLGFLLVDARSTSNMASLNAVGATLRAIAFGGINDQLGGGVHRYATEPSWSVPHFEKMLFDNAQLISVYSAYYSQTRAPFAGRMVSDIVGYLKSRMTAPDGGFYTAEDADIDGHEGVSYLWSQTEIVEILGRGEAERFLEVYEMTALPEAPGGAGVLRIRKDLAGEVTGQSALLQKIVELEPSRRKLLAIRDKRPQPMRDDKIVVSLNGLAISALVQAGKIIERPEWITMAARAGEFLWSKAYDKKSGQLSRYVFKGKAWGEGFLEDYAALGLGFLQLDDALSVPGGEHVWRQRAGILAAIILNRFMSPEGVMVTRLGSGSLIVPAIDMQDGDTPSGSSMAYALLLRLGRDEPRYNQAADNLLKWMAPKISASPDAWVSFLANLSSSTASSSATSVLIASNIDSAPHVKARARGRSSGERDEVEIMLKIEDGYHINANPASLEFLVPTRVIIPAGLKAKITYPTPRLFKTKFVDDGILVYEGDVVIKAELASGSLRKLQLEKLQIEVQACTVKVCLEPSIIMVPIEFK